MTTTETTAPETYTPPARQLPGPVYALTGELEHNWHDDSDFYRIVLDCRGFPRLVEWSTWSTRYAAPANPDAGLVLPAQVPESAWQLAEAIFADLLNDRMVNEERRTVMEPGPREAQHGIALRTLRPVRIKRGTRFDEIPAGTVGEVFWSGQFCRMYRGGYNRPSRDNTRVGLRTARGERFFCALRDCRMAREIVPTEQIRERALAIAARRQFAAAV